MAAYGEIPMAAVTVYNERLTAKLRVQRAAARSR
jgi:hypothetical protein